MRIIRANHIIRGVYCNTFDGVYNMYNTTRILLMLRKTYNMACYMARSLQFYMQCAGPGCCCCCNVEHDTHNDGRAERGGHEGQGTQQPSPSCCSIQHASIQHTSTQHASTPSTPRSSKPRSSTPRSTVRLRCRRLRRAHARKSSSAERAAARRAAQDGEGRHAPALTQRISI